MARVVGIISALAFDGDPNKLTKSKFDQGERVAREISEAAKKPSKPHSFKYAIGNNLKEVVEIINKQVCETLTTYGLSPSDFHFRFIYEEFEGDEFYLPYGREHSATNAWEV